MKNNTSPWEIPFITKVGSWLCKEGHLGYGLFLIHGCHLGLKMKHQLKLKWKDVINEDGSVKDVIVFDSINDRPLSELLKVCTLVVYNRLKPNLNDMLYVNERNQKALVTNTLNRELAKHVKAYKAHLMPVIDKHSKGDYSNAGIQRLYGSVLKIEDYPLTTASLEIAWAKEYVKSHNYSIRAFRRVSRIMKHTSLQQTFDVIEYAPKEEEDITPKYNYYSDLDKKQIQDLIQDIIKIDLED